jgi:exopolysaccharide production protein ExoQ
MVAPLKPWHYYATGYILLMNLQAFDIIDRLIYGAWAGKTGDKITENLNLLLIATSLALFVSGVQRIRSIQRGAILAIGITLLLFSSTAWSIAPDLSFRQSLLYTSGVLSAIGIVLNVDGDEFMELLALICFLCATVSLVLLVTTPRMALGEDGDFYGIFSQKNGLGAAMTMGALASLHSLRARKRRRAISAIFLGVITITAVKSSSATSYFAIFLFCFIDVMIALMQKGGGARILGLIGSVVSLAVVTTLIFFQDSTLELLGKDPTLTGRTDLWAMVIPDIYQRPLLGWGYMAFWSSDSPAAKEISDALGWHVPQAHNGILEILLNIGLIGTAFFLFLWGRNVGLAFQCMKIRYETMAITCLLSCVGLVFAGFTEVVLVYYGTSTAVFFVSGFYCEKTVQVARWRLSASRRYVRPVVGRSKQATLRRPVHVSLGSNEVIGARNERRLRTIPARPIETTSAHLRPNLRC